MTGGNFTSIKFSVYGVAMGVAAVIGMLAFSESMGVFKLFGILLVIGSIVIMNMVKTRK